MFNKKSKTNQTYTDVIFIDPGITGTGWAYWREINTNGPKTSPKAHGAYTPKQRTSTKWQGKAEVVCSYLDGIFNSLPPETIVIEWPEVWPNSTKSITAARKGDLFKLVYLIGGIGELVRDRGVNLPILVTANQWKGQLPKRVVIKRIKAAFPSLGVIKNHEGDALGMGLAAMGLL